MTNNDVLRGLRYLMNVSDTTLLEIAALGGREISRNEIVAYLKREEEPGHLPCPHDTMAAFLNGLVTWKRGPAPAGHSTPALEVPITNNIVLKKMRVAFELRDTDLLELIRKSGQEITKAELGAFFRAPSHRNYRECGDQFLRNLLKGMTP